MVYYMLKMEELLGDVFHQQLIRCAHGGKGAKKARLSRKCQNMGTKG